MWANRTEEELKVSNRILLEDDILHYCSPGLNMKICDCSGKCLT